MNAYDTLNGKNLLDIFNLVIQTGAEQFLEYPERKETLTNDWAEENGQDYDLELVKFKDKEVTLSCALMAPDDGDFWPYYQSFFFGGYKARLAESLYLGSFPDLQSFLQEDREF